MVLLRPVHPIVSHPPHYLHKLPTEDEDRLGKLIRSLDLDGSVRIDIRDLSVALQELTIRRKYAEKCLNRSDQSSSGGIYLAAFIGYLREHEKTFRPVFSNIDRNRDVWIRIGVSTLFLTSGEPSYYMYSSLSFTGGILLMLLTPGSYINCPCPHFRLISQHKHLDIEEDSNAPDDVTEKELQTRMWWRYLVAGGIAGAVSRTCTAPLDRAKVYLQVHGTRNFNIRTCFKNMITEGGPWSLWRGNGINVLKIAPESALKFMVYEQAKTFISSNSSNNDLTIQQRFIAGSVAGGFSQTVIYPLEVLKTRLTLRKTDEYKSIMDAAKKILKNEGLKSFYRGYVPNMFGIVPYAGIDLACYETLKNKYLQTHIDETASPMVLFACGTCSSTCGLICNYPLVLVRTRLQATSDNKYTMISQFREILQNEGLVGLYRGITLNLLKAVPTVGISYIVYEYCKQILGVNMT